MSKYFKFFAFLSIFILSLAFSPNLSSAANCNLASPKITITTITTQQPDPTPKFLKSEILNKNRITQTTDVYGGAIVRVTVEDPTNNSCYFNRLGNISGCKMTKTERKAGQVVATSTSYFLQPSSKQFIFTPKDLTSNLVLDFSCGTASGKYSIGSAICERPFDQIVGDLNANRHTLITEKSFRDWAKDDKFDNCGFGFLGLFKCNNKYSYPNPPYVNSPVKSANSGDKGDITENIKQIQSCYELSLSSSLSPYEAPFLAKNAKSNLLKAKKWTDLNFPLALEVKHIENQKVIGYHALVALKVRQYSNVLGDDSFDLIALDSNGPGLHLFFCKEDEIPASYMTGGEKTTYKCRDSSVDKDDDSLFFTPMKAVDPSTLVEAFQFFCKSNLKTKFCQDRQINLSSWLKENYPNISNPPRDNGEGSCVGWVDFVLRTTYLGEFGYECPRPGSGSASTLKSLQLANIQESINQIIEQIKNLKIDLI